MIRKIHNIGNGINIMLWQTPARLLAAAGNHTERYFKGKQYRFLRPFK